MNNIQRSTIERAAELFEFDTAAQVSKASMSDWDYPGAKWWKFDFHTHTPASIDFVSEGVTPEDWLRHFMDREIDCVAVTDHNSGSWIDKLKSAYTELQIKGPNWYRDLHIFPGVELSVNGGIHVLAIFDKTKSTSDIDSLIGAVGYTGVNGKTDAETSKSFEAVVDEIVNANGVAIPAHVDGRKGLFSMTGIALKQAVSLRDLLAVEIVNLECERPELYQQASKSITEIRGSDTHDIQTSSGRFTWIKMGALPSIEGLKLALIDGFSSVNLNQNSQPNRHAEMVIESVFVKNAKFMGRRENFVCKLSPFLNTIIGGRGSGKSTLLEFIRLTMRRKSELPPSLVDEFQSYYSAQNDGLLTDKSQISLIYRKQNDRYRLSWQEDARRSLEVYDRDQNKWKEIEGEITDLFPVRIYSQKQIFELAKDPQALLGLIDQAPEIGIDNHNRCASEHLGKCKRIVQERIELKHKIGEENKLKGQLHDLTRQIRHEEKSEFQEILYHYRSIQQVLNEIEQIEQHWGSVFKSIENTISEFVQLTPNERVLENHPEVNDYLNELTFQLQSYLDSIEGIIIEQKDSSKQMHKKKHALKWMHEFNEIERQYLELQTQFEKQGIDPKHYSDMLRRRNTVEAELKKISEYQQQIEALDAEYESEKRDARLLREYLTENRRKFLKNLLDDNFQIGIEVKGFAESWNTVETKLREIMHLGSRFERDMHTLKNLYSQTNGWESVKSRLIEIRNDSVAAEDKRFQTHLQDLSEESIVLLDLWFPEDSLEITFGKNKKKLSKGSPGQRCAALLSFILAYGSEPLLLDQPEDDLDNDLIYILIVKEIRDMKLRRQIIAVTHNANVVVNGDSEMVHCLKVANGQSDIESDSLQTQSIRKKICETLEGGNDAFEQRYKRINLES